MNLVYLAYTLIGGPLAGDWYPYPFVDPIRDGGYLRVALFAVALSLLLALLAYGLSRLGDRHRESRRGF